MNEKLRVGIMLDSYSLPSWQFLLVEQILESRFASIQLVILNDRRSAKSSFLTRVARNWKNLLFNLYLKLDRKIFRATPDAFESTDALDMLSKVPVIKVRPEMTKASDRLTEEDVARIKERNLDVIVRFGFRILRGAVLSASRYGIWSYHHGDNLVNRGGPAGVWEVLEGWDITGSVLQVLSEDLDGGKVLYRSYSVTDRRSVNRSRNQYYWKSNSFLLRALSDLHREGASAYFERVDEANAYPCFYSGRLFSSRDLGNWVMGKYLASLLYRYAKDKLNDLFFQRSWILMYSFGNGASRSFWRFKRIIPPKDRFFADPFIVHKNGAYYIFIEEYMRGSEKAHISVIRMDDSGNFEDPVKVLEANYHLSYPFVFEEDGVYYMIPESRSNRTVDLYKCVEFPIRWEFHTRLMDGIEAVDATLFYYEKKWWLFCNMVENPGALSFDELFLFYSDSFSSQDWTPHPLNPIVSDVRRSRPAGNIFTHNNRILRPAQNSSKRYGFGLKFHEIKVLSEDDYQEVEVESVEPNWHRDILATHTFNSTGHLTMIDGLMKRRRFF